MPRTFFITDHSLSKKALVFPQDDMEHPKVVEPGTRLAIKHVQIGHRSQTLCGHKLKTEPFLPSIPLG